MPQDLMMELGEAAFNQVVNKYMSSKGVKPTGENRNRTVDFLYSNPDKVREIASELEMLVEGEGGEVSVKQKTDKEKEPFNMDKALGDGKEEETTGRK